MSRTFRASLVAVATLSFWVVYALLDYAAEQQRLPSGRYGEVYGPLNWARGAWFWMSVVVTTLCTAAILLVVRRRRHAA